MCLLDSSSCWIESNWSHFGLLSSSSFRATPKAAKWQPLVIVVVVVVSLFVWMHSREGQPRRLSHWSSIGASFGVLVCICRQCNNNAAQTATCFFVPCFVHLCHSWPLPHVFDRFISGQPDEWTHFGPISSFNIVNWLACVCLLRN